MAPRPVSKTITLPRPPFLWTLDQIAALLNVTMADLRKDYIHFDSLSAGARHQTRIVARDISPPTADQPEWRVSEVELIRWMRQKGFKPAYRDYY